MPEFIFVLFASYALGSISTAVIVCHLFGLPDPRTQGSNNPGATNVLRTAGRWPAVIVLLGDALKGWVAVWATRYLGLSEWAVAGAMLGAVIGHIFPVFFQFRGGKGIATALGAMLALSPVVALGLTGIWLLTLMISRFVSLASLTAVFCAPLFVILYVGSPIYFWTTLLMSVLLAWRHQDNIKRLRAGAERKLGERSSAPSQEPPVPSVVDLNQKVFHLKNEEATVLLAKQLASYLQAPLLCTFSGELGAGKTTFIRSVLQASGYTGRVKSPSFTLLESYSLAGKEFHHFDLYRVQNPQELNEFGVEECLSHASIIFVEWPEHDHFYFTNPDLLFYFQYVGEQRTLTILGETVRGREMVRLLK